MSKIAFIFPGQGAQKVSMGKELYDQEEVVKNIFDKANDVLGYDLKEICFEDSKNVINETVYSQPAIFTTSVAILELLKSRGITCDGVTGLSLGEYTALYEAGSFDFETGLKLVSKRGKLMNDVCSEVSGTMAAIIGMQRDSLNDVCNKVEGIVSIANFNCPGQLVITGEKDAVSSAMELAKESGARRAIELSVSGPFHSPIIKSAADKYSEFINGIELKNPSKNIAMNVTGKYFETDLKTLMVDQITSGVKFEDCINTLINDGFDTFIEVGPNKVLSGFMKKIDKTKTILNIEDVASLEKTLEALK